MTHHQSGRCSRTGGPPLWPPVRAAHCRGSGGSPSGGNTLLHWLREEEEGLGEEEAQTALGPSNVRGPLWRVGVWEWGGELSQEMTERAAH